MSCSAIQAIGCLSVTTTTGAEGGPKILQKIIVFGGTNIKVLETFLKKSEKWSKICFFDCFGHHVWPQQQLGGRKKPIKSFENIRELA